MSVLSILRLYKVKKRNVYKILFKLTQDFKCLT